MAISNINRIVLTGNLTADLELKTLASATSLCRLRVACNTARKGESGKWEAKPNFFDVKVYGNQAEMLSQHLAKGRRIGIDGRLDWRSWEAQDGSKRSKVDVVAQSVQFLDSRQDAEGGGVYVPAGAGASADDFPSTPADDDIPF